MQDWTASSSFPLMFIAPDTTEPGVLGTILGCAVPLIGLAFSVLILAGCWKAFAKAGQAGWKALIPIYNLVVLMQIVGRPVWWVVLLFVPLVNVIAGVLVSIDLAKSFGRSVLYGIGLLLLAPFFVVHLGFGSPQYRGPAAAG